MATTVVALHSPESYDIGGIDGSGQKVWHGTLVGPAAYATGGEVIATLISVLTGKTILNIIGGVGKDWTPRLLAGKLAWFVASTGVQVANAVDISTSGTVPVAIFYK